jgi:hypothetical protein
VCFTSNFYGSKTAVSRDKENQANVCVPCIAPLDACKKIDGHILHLNCKLCKGYIVLKVALDKARVI